MKTLTTQQIETLKKLEWVETDNYFMTRNLPDQVFLDLTDIDPSSIYDSIYLPVSNKIEYYKSSVYKNGEKYFLQYTIFVDGVEWAKGNFAMFGNDLLELYAPKWESLLGNALKKVLAATDVDSIVEFIDNNYADVSNKIRENFCENLEVDDIGEVLKQDIAKDWIGHNSDDAYDRAMHNMDSHEIKDKIIDYLQNNL